jgi:hypothetical protein
MLLIFVAGIIVGLATSWIIPFRFAVALLLSLSLAWAVVAGIASRDLAMTSVSTWNAWNHALGGAFLGALVAFVAGKLYVKTRKRHPA